MIALSLQLVTLAACAVIVTRSDPALNRMSRQTPILLRISMWLLLLGALGESGAIVFYGHIPTTPVVLAFTGMATLMVCERRLRALTGPLARRRLDSREPS